MHKVTKQYRAEIAHRLPDHPGACKFLHGHSYQFDITAEANSLNPGGMVIDFKNLKYAIERLIGPWDHSTILWVEDPLFKMLATKDPSIGLRVLPFPTIPTAENMAKFIYISLDLELKDVKISNVRVWETSTSYADYSEGCLC